ncbi:MAG: type II toxin-antitoxin system YafQ family toxin [Betaproteobacteria bacterium]
MREIVVSKQFTRDLKRERKGRYGRNLDDLLDALLDLLVNDQPLPKNYADHPLKGDSKGYRDCHVKPDLVLIYRKVGADELHLARLGSHAELFG